MMRLIAVSLLLAGTALAPAADLLTEGFGRFGRFNDDGLLTLNVWPDRAEVPGLTVRFAESGVVPTVTTIDTTMKRLALAPAPAGDATAVVYTLLHPGIGLEFGTTARLRLSRDTLTIDPLAAPGGGPVRGLLLRPATGAAMVPVAIAFPEGIVPQWQFNDLGSTAELVLTAAAPMGLVRVVTPNGVRTLAANAPAVTVDAVRAAAAEWVGRGLPTMTQRRAAVDFAAGTVTITEDFSVAGGAAYAPVPPVLAFAMANGYPATVAGTLRRSGFPTRQGEFAWVDGAQLVYTLPIPPLEERGLLRPAGREAEVALLNDMADRMGASWARNAVDLAYAGMTPAQQSWPMLTPAKREALATAWRTYLPFALRLPPYPPGDTRTTWTREVEPLSGLEYIYTYFITGGPGNAYKLDVEWGNLLPVYGIAKYAQFTGDWALVRDNWSTIRAMTRYTDLADDWAWMTNVNGDMGWSTGTGDPMTAAYVGHVAAARMARALGDEAAAGHYAYRAARVAVPAVSRFWYIAWARQQGFIGPNSIVQGFWEKGTFTATTMLETATDPWGPTNPLSGNGCQHEFFAALMRFAPAALAAYEDAMLAGYPNLFNPDHVYTISTTYGGNSVYVTFPHLYARIWLGQPTAELWTLAGRAQSNRRTTGWIAPVVLAELLARDTPLHLTEWQPLRWNEGTVPTPGVVALQFTAPTRQTWRMEARLTPPAPVGSVTLGGQTVPFHVEGDRLTIEATVEGTFDVLIRMAAAPCPREVQVDNEDALAFRTTGTWALSGNTPFIGSTSLYGPTGAGPSTATWTATLACPGVYDVFATWVAAGNRAPAAVYRITHADGTTDRVVDQRLDGNRWNLLGRHRFAAGADATITLRHPDGTASGYLSADAVRLVLVESGAPQGWMAQ